MKGRYYQEIHNVKLHVIALYGVILLLFILTLAAMYGWKNAPKDLRVHIPPNLDYGGVVKVGEVPKPVVYAFAHFFFQQLNNWRADGAVDYATNDSVLRDYLTPRFHTEVQKEIAEKNRLGELRGRVRTVQEILGRSFSEDRVEDLGQGRWRVWLDYELKETLLGVTVKSPYVRYAIEVIRYNIDPARNPWGLALDSYESQRITLEAAEEAAKKPEAK